MNEPVERKEEKKAPERARLWPPLLFIGGLFLGGYVLSEIDKESPGSASVIVRWIIGFGVVGFVGWLLAGKSLAEIAKGTRYLIKGMLILIVVVLVLGPLTKCSDGSREPTDTYFRR
jgi:predicted MFS family arabinose efflux permease